MTPDPHGLENTVIMGTQYYRPPTPPMNEWEADLAAVAELGFDAIKYWAYWGWHERRPDGFTWEDTDRLFELADANGLKIVCNILMELPPSWLEAPYPLQKQDGTATVRAHFPSIPFPCFDQPEVRQAGEPFIRALVERYRHHPALLLWDAWNEPRSHNECSCPASMKAYHDWLADSFGSIESFNKQFGKCYHSFDAIPANTCGACYSETYLWRTWAAHSVADRVRWVADIVREGDPDHPVMAHCGWASALTPSIRFDTTNDPLNARSLDFYGSSYPVSGMMSQNYATERDPSDGTHPAIAEDTAFLGPMIVDWIRSFSDPAWVCELYPNKHTFWVDDFDASDIHMWMMSILASGSKSVFIWQYRPERVGTESGGYGLVTQEGRPTDRSAAAAAVNTLVGRHRQRIARSRPARGVGLFYDPRSDMISSVELARGVGMNCKQTLCGAYHLLWDANAPIDFVTPDHLGDAESDSILYMPYTPYMDDSLAGSLRAFVNEGGTVISEAHLGCRQPNTWLSSTIPGQGLGELFGVTEQQRRILKAPVELDTPYGPVTFRDHQIELAVQGAEVLAAWPDGSPAITQRATGKGRAIYIGGFMGLSYRPKGTPSYPATLVHWLEQLGYEAPLKVTDLPPGHSVRWRIAQSEEGWLVWLMNWGETPATCSVKWPSQNVTHLKPQNDIPIDPQPRVDIPPKTVHLYHCH
jgi:beta-galactosidase GanA